MNFREQLQKFGLSKLKIKISVLEAEFDLNDVDKDAAWSLYIELLTRTTTQALQNEHGDEKTALESIYTIFPLTRKIIKKHGKKCISFTKIAIVVLNQIIRPFTAKWHRESMAGAFSCPNKCNEFRKELSQLQKDLSKYTKLLADMAGVEDLTEIEDYKGEYNEKA